MKLQQLFESELELATFLRDKCAQALDLFKDGVYFYRGTSMGFDTTPYAVEGRPTVHVSEIITVDKDRKPRDTPEFAHNVMDKWFKKHMGFKARSQGLFVTTDSLQAQSYGAVYFVLPVGKFNAYWSPEIRDLTMTLYRNVHLKPDMDPTPGDMDHWNAKGYETKDDVPKREQVAYIEDVLKNGNYKKNHFNDIQNVGEIMIDCKEYVLIPKTMADRKTLDMIARGEIQ